MKKIYVLICSLFISLSVYSTPDRDLKIELKTQLTEMEFGEFKSFILTKRGIIDAQYIIEKKVITIKTEDRITDTELKELFKDKKIETLNL
jgi:hypothetical protein